LKGIKCMLKETKERMKSGITGTIMN